MRSKQLALDRYNTDKTIRGYLEIYDPILQPFVDKEVKLLEIGIHKGGSLMLWRDYFPRGTIAGIDIKPPKGFSPGSRVTIFEGNQANTRFLCEVANTVAPKGFDIIIDDASHIGELTRKAFWYLFENHLKPGGLYIIEDWYTGYWDDWPDGKSYSHKVSSSAKLRWRLLGWLGAIAAKHHLNPPSSLYLFSKAPSHNHSYGMVGFVKELVDEQGAAEMTRAHSNNAPKRQSKFESIIITPSIVFVKKVELQKIGNSTNSLENSEILYHA